MQEPRAQGPLGDVPRAVSEQKHKERRGQSEPEPRRESAQIAPSNQADPEAGLARGGAGEKLRKRDQIDIGALAQPATALVQAINEAWITIAALTIGALLCVPFAKKSSPQAAP